MDRTGVEKVGAVEATEEVVSSEVRMGCVSDDRGAAVVVAGAETEAVHLVGSMAEVVPVAEKAAEGTGVGGSRFHKRCLR